MPLDARLALVDRDEDVVRAWRQCFEEKHPEVEIHQGDLLDTGADAIVVPGNGFGYLDRGLELQLCERWGWEFQDRLRETVRERFHGEFLVGQAVRLPVESGPVVVYTCIYRTPQALDNTLHAYLAARGAFLALQEPGAPRLERLAMPGLGTGSAGLPPLVSARQLRYAWQIATGQRGFGDKNLSQLQRRERKLKSLPAWALEGTEPPGPSGAR